MTAAVTGSGLITAVLKNGKWEVSYGTTADFEYCPVCGSFNDHYAEDEDDIYNSGYSCGEFAIATSDELIDEINKFEKNMKTMMSIL